MNKPWNRPSYPVWSLSTIDTNNVPNMNICTYVIPVSMKPKKFCIAIYKGTKTYENISQTKTAVLQLLSEEQYDIVRLLGKNSGSTKDKLKSVSKKHPVEIIENIPYMTSSLAYCVLSFDTMIPTQGDHDIILGHVTAYKNLNTGNVLTTAKLSELNIISL